MKKQLLTTTFARLRKAGACKCGYAKLAKYLGGVRKYGQDTPINLLTILDSNGIDDAAWSFRATEQDSDKAAQALYEAIKGYKCPCSQMETSIWYYTSDSNPSDASAIRKLLKR